MRMLADAAVVFVLGEINADQLYGAKWPGSARAGSGLGPTSALPAGLCSLRPKSGHGAGPKRVQTVLRSAITP